MEFSKRDSIVYNEIIYKGLDINVSYNIYNYVTKI